jgi:hypothetical protein
MKKQVIEQLNLSPRSEVELHETLNRFEAKWLQKADRLN